MHVDETVVVLLYVAYIGRYVRYVVLLDAQEHVSDLVVTQEGVVGWPLE